MSMSPSSSGHVNMMKGQPFHVKYREIIRRLMFLIGALLVFRLGAHIPLPGIDNVALARFLKPMKEPSWVYLICSLAVH